jgi:hypothetical protein
MQSPDRSRFIELLGQLGAEDDATVLAAARELHRTVQDAGLDWDRLLQADGAPDAELEDEPEAAPVAEPKVSPEAIARADKSDDMKIVDRLLARKGLSDELRNDLAEFKRNIREGTLDKMDADYIRALAKRLGA